MTGTPPPITLHPPPPGNVRVQPEAFHATAQVFAAAGPRLSTALNQLVGALGQLTGCAGVDNGAREFDAAYQPVAASLVSGFDRAVNLLSDIGLGIDLSGMNHWRADAAATPGHPGEPPWTPSTPGPAIPMDLRVPSLVGKPIAELPGDWARTVPMGGLTRLRACGEAYDKASQAVIDITSDCYTALRSLFADNTSHDLDCLQEFWSHVGGDHAILSALNDTATKLQKGLYDYADWVDDTVSTVLETILRFLAEVGLDALVGLAVGLVSEGMSGLPTLVKLVNDAGRGAVLLAAVETAVATAGLPARLAAVGAGVGALHGAMTAAIDATPNPDLGAGTAPSAATDAQATEQAENLADTADSGDLPALKTDSARLEKKFKHAQQFGVGASRGREGFAEFESKLQDFVHDRETTRKLGTYRRESVILNYNSESRLMVMQKPDGTLVSAWRMTKEQLENVTARGSL